jgi:hypothetical protein
MVEKTLAEGNVDHIYLVDAITFSLATVSSPAVSLLY